MLQAGNAGADEFLRKPSSAKLYDQLRSLVLHGSGPVAHAKVCLADPAQVFNRIFLLPPADSAIDHLPSAFQTPLAVATTREPTTRIALMNSSERVRRTTLHRACTKSPARTASTKCTSS